MKVYNEIQTLMDKYQEEIEEYQQFFSVHTDQPSYPNGRCTKLKEVVIDLQRILDKLE